MKIPFGKKGGTIAATLCVPTDQFSGRANKLVLIAHGQAGNKNYCYQRILSETLAKKQGISSVRFDFRGCGDSSDDDVEGSLRTIHRDAEDLQRIYEFFCLPDKNGVTKFVLIGVVGHSRGSAAMFHWALSAQNRTAIPGLVNCSGRYDYRETQAFVDKNLPKAKIDGGYWLKSYRLGESKERWESYEEMLHLSNNTDMTLVKNLDPTISVLSIYGLEDKVVHINSAASFANDLDGRHRLELVPGADHNYYGGAKEINYNPLVADIITDWFGAEKERERFMKLHQYSGTISRWKHVGGVNNFRDFGGYKSKLFQKTVRPNLLFRSASVSAITEEGKQELARLGIKTIFDLRSDHEVEKKPCPRGLPEGVTIRRTPVYKHQDLDPESLAKRYANYADPVAGFERAYTEIITKAGPGCYREILMHLKERPQDGILIHCTAGKDRTGVICAIILLLLGVDNDTVSREYELTTHGLANEIENILDAISAERDSWNDNLEGMKHMLSSTYGNMLQFINALEKSYGGAEAYVRNYCGLSEQDIAVLRHNLIAEEGQGWQWIH